MNEHQELMRNHSIEKWIDVVAKDKTDLEKSLMYGDIQMLISGICPKTLEPFKSYDTMTDYLNDIKSND